MARIKQWISFIVLITVCDTVGAQTRSKEAEQYIKESESVRKEVWGWSRPEFQIREVPAEYANASKVVIARHIELSADSKKKLVFEALLGFGVGLKRSQMLYEIVRETVKLNDKAAVEEYSQIKYTQFLKKRFSHLKDKATNYIGVRIIKQNGSIKEINADDIILTKDEVKEKQAKIAVPDLQQGDIIDYFIASDITLETEEVEKDYSLFLFDEVPIMNLSFHSVTGKKFALKIRNYNGASKPTITTNDDDAIICDFKARNMAPVDIPIWSAGIRQLPFVRIRLTLATSSAEKKEREAEVMGINTETVFTQKAESLARGFTNYYYSPVTKTLYDETKDKVKRMGLSFNDLTEEEKAAHIYYTLRYNMILDFNVNGMAGKINVGKTEFNGLLTPLFAVTQKANMKPGIIIGENRTGIKLKDALSTADCEMGVYLSGINKILRLKSIFTFPFEVPEEFDGVTGSGLRNLTFASRMTGIKFDASVPLPAIRASKATDNMRTEELTFSLTNDRSGLKVERSTTLKGYYKEATQSALVLYEDLLNYERSQFNEKRTLIEELEDSRKGKKVVDEVISAFAEARKEQKNAFEAEAHNMFDQEITDLKNNKTVQLGVRHTAPNFIYSSEFNMNGLVKKAGNNTILEIGKILGNPIDLKDKNAKRTLDIYMPFARTIDYNIEIVIPEGYAVDGLEALNTSVQNEVGSFITKSTIQGNKLLIKVRKQYLHNYEPAAKYPMLVDIINAGNEWTNAKILFRKS